MATKSYKVGFYVGSVGADGLGGKVSTKLQEFFLSTDKAPVINEADLEYQIRDLVSLNKGSVFKGVFAKIRTSDIPHIGSSTGGEREIDLADGEGVIDKNHFLYYSSQELLVYQSNGNGSTIEAFGRYFTRVFDKTTTFNAVLKEDSMARLMNMNLQPKFIELSVARPTNPNFYPQDEWSKQFLELLASVGGYNASIRISGETIGRHKKPLLKKVKQSAMAFVENGYASVARITMEEVEQPIDLIADRIVAKVSVSMNGRYPVTSEIYKELERAKSENQQELDKVFGTVNVID